VPDSKPKTKPPNVPRELYDLAKRIIAQTIIRNAKHSAQAKELKDTTANVRLVAKTLNDFVEVLRAEIDRQLGWEE
jgi:hypothetical protein